MYFDVVITRKNPYDKFYRTYLTEEQAQREKNRIVSTKKYKKTLVSAVVIPHDENPSRSWLEKEEK